MVYRQAPRPMYMMMHMVWLRLGMVRVKIRVR